MRRLRGGWVAALLVLAAAVAHPATARAENEVERAKREVEEARVLVDKAVALSGSGKRAQSYRAARSAYLEHFEFAEVPLRVRDPNLVLDVEFAFAGFRNDIRGGKPQEEIRGSAREVRRGLDRVRRVLADPGFAAPALAAGFAFSIIFREGLEAVLLIAVLLGTLEAGRAAGYQRPLVWGVGAALVATAVTWVLAAVVIDIAPLQRELLEAVTSLVALAVLFFVGFWLMSRLEQRRWMEFMRSRVSAAIAAGSALAFAGLGFTAVYREGFETVLFYQALLLFAEGLTLWVAVGALAGAVALGGAGYAVLKLGRRLPVRAFLGGAATVVLFLSIAFVGNAVRSLQGADVLSVTPVEWDVVRLPVLLAELTGIHPTKESLAAQAALALVYLAGFVYLFVWIPARRRVAQARA